MMSSHALGVRGQTDQPQAMNIYLWNVVNRKSNFGITTNNNNNILYTGNYVCNCNISGIERKFRMPIPLILYNRTFSQGGGGMLRSISYHKY